VPIPFFFSRIYLLVSSDLQEIPDIEVDEAVGGSNEDDITTQVAEAPNVRSSKVQSLRELDDAAVHQLPVRMHHNWSRVPK
jgi:hypothetical protein